MRLPTFTFALRVSGRRSWTSTGVAVRQSMLLPCLLKGALVAFQPFAVVLGEYGLVFRTIRSLVAVGSTWEAIRLKPEFRLGGTGRSTTVVAPARAFGLRQGCQCHSDSIFNTRSRLLRGLRVGVILSACSMAASSCQWTHRCLSPSAMSIKDDMLLALLLLL